MEQKFREFTKTDVSLAVKDHYRKMRQNQTFDYVKRMHNKYLNFNNPMELWEAMYSLDNLIDVSDPDLDLPNVQHLIQSAEAIRNDNRPDWMQLTGLIHDLGKTMYLWGCDKDGTSQKEQWGLVGDVFVVGCSLPKSCVFPEFNKLNPDMENEKYNTQNGIYQDKCGLDNLTLAWGHDEYLFQVLKNHKTNDLPEEAMAMIRYHSFYPWHTGMSYSSLLNEKDKQYLEWIKDFNKYDLYTKSNKTFDLDEIIDYYDPIAKKYLGDTLIYW